MHSAHIKVFQNNRSNYRDSWVLWSYSNDGVCVLARKRAFNLVLVRFYLVFINTYSQCSFANSFGLSFYRVFNTESFSWDIGCTACDTLFSSIKVSNTIEKKFTNFDSLFTVKKKKTDSANLTSNSKYGSKYAKHPIWFIFYSNFRFLYSFGIRKLLYYMKRVKLQISGVQLKLMWLWCSAN